MLTERFWSKVQENPDTGCWEWQGSTTQGYGQVRFQGAARPAHRLAYRDMVGEIPEGLVLDHLCVNPPCVNPYHLDPVPQRVNMIRALVKPECKRGHPRTPENTSFRRNGERFCRVCNTEGQRRAAPKTGPYKKHPDAIADILANYQPGRGGNAIELATTWDLAPATISRICKRHALQAQP